MNESNFAESKTSLEEKIDRAIELYKEGRLSVEEISMFLGVDNYEVQSLFYEMGILPKKTLLILGGAGFIGSNFIKHILKKYPHYRIINYDKLTYAGNPQNLKEVENDPRYVFIHADIADMERLEQIFKSGVDFVVNFAAETHVDRSIQGTGREFLFTNVLGVQNILNLLKKYSVEKYVHISTDEVYGALDENSNFLFDEKSGLNPRNPYSATKASADCLILAYHNTYNVPVVIVRPSNNFGPSQYPEKLVPYFIFLASRGSNLTLYGDGKNMREWLHVFDNCEAIDKVLHQGRIGQIYNVGGGEEKENLEIAKLILDILEKPHSMITFIRDRPGHDKRYALDSSKIQKELKWRPKSSFEERMIDTISWYNNNYDWVLHSLKRGQFFDEHTKK